METNLKNTGLKLFLNGMPQSFLALRGSSVVKNLPANAGDAGLIPESGRAPGEGNSNPLQYSCLRNLMDRGAWWAIVLGVAKSWTQPK